MPHCRSRSLAALMLLTLVVGATACRRDESTPRPTGAFCTAAARLDERLSAGAGIGEQVRLVRRLVETAPPEIEADARTFLDALERVRADPDDPDLLDDPDVREAVERVNRFAIDGCELLERDGGSPF